MFKGLVYAGIVVAAIAAGCLGTLLDGDPHNETGSFSMEKRCPYKYESGPNKGELDWPRCTLTYLDDEGLTQYLNNSDDGVYHVGIGDDKTVEVFYSEYTSPAFLKRIEEAMDRIEDLPEYRLIRGRIGPLQYHGDGLEHMHTP